MRRRPAGTRDAEEINDQPRPAARPDAPSSGPTSECRIGVSLRPTRPTYPRLEVVAGGAARVAGGTVAESLGWAVALGPEVSLPGGAEESTVRRWELLATVAAVDVTLARVAEPHLDALAILDEAGAERPVTPPDASWGVFAAEGPAPRLEATPGPDGWALSGVKPWCSLAGDLTHALVTAWMPDQRRGLFAVDLRDPRVVVEAGTWAPAGLRDVVSTPVRMTAAPAGPVGGPGWYLSRPGFAWGGMGVAAVWYGGAVGVARRLREAASRREPDQIMLMHLGAVHAGLSAARAVLVEAAEDIDSGRLTGPAAQVRAATVRQVVAEAAEQVLTRVGHALGPAPLTQEADHARRVADLTLYLRQSHAERDQAALGRSWLAGPEDSGW